MKTKPATFLRAQVNGWMYRRGIRVLPDQVALQVTVPTCSHCPTCQSRVRHFVETLAGKPTVLHQWKYLEDGANWLFLPLRRGQDALKVLREVLGVRLHVE